MSANPFPLNPPDARFGPFVRFVGREFAGVPASIWWTFAAMFLLVVVADVAQRLSHRGRARR